jgi:hypothetical protein
VHVLAILYKFLIFIATAYSYSDISLLLCNYKFSYLLHFSLSRDLENSPYFLIILQFLQYAYKRDLAYCPVFSKLKTLVLNEWCVAIDLHGLVRILQHTPILEKLTLQLCNDEVCSSICDITVLIML